MSEKARRLLLLPAALLCLFVSSNARAAAVANCAPGIGHNEGDQNPFMNCPRAGHTVTMLASGDLLIAGGVTTNAGVISDSYEIDQQQKGLYTLWGSAKHMVVARSSHTATLLPNGKVLVTGGISNAGVILNSAELYDPLANTWTASAGNLTTARYNHTATLLRNGKVLICGGQSDAAGTALSDCRFYDPATDTFSHNQDLLTARTLHSAVLLSDGRVLFSGGFNGTFTPTYLSNQEIYDPLSDTFTGAHGLIQGRAYHTATAMGNGTVLFVGGYNQSTELNSFGILGSAETYDPISDSVAPAAPLCVGTDLSACIRIKQNSTVLDPDGPVVTFGGLGNVTTGFFNPSFNTGSNNLLRVSRCVPPIEIIERMVSTSSVRSDASADCLGAASSTTLTVQTDFRIRSAGGNTLPVMGVIQSGTIYLSTPSMKFANGFAFFGTTDPLTGPQIDLAGRQVNCDAVACGHIGGTFKLLNLGGYAGFFPTQMTQTAEVDIPDANACIAFNAPNPLTASNGPAAINPAGTGCGGRNKIDMTNVTMSGLPTNLIGSKLSSGTIVVSGGQIDIQTTTPDPGVTGGLISFTITIKTGHLTISAPTGAIFSDPTTGQGDVTISAAVWTNLAGTVITTSTNPVQSPLLGGSGVTITETGCGGGSCTSGPLTFKVTNIQGSITYVPDQLDVSNTPLTIDVATVVIRSMVMADFHSYDPQKDQWTLNAGPSQLCAQGSSDIGCHPYNERFGATATLLPNHTIRILGGYDCNDPYHEVSGTCTSMPLAGTDARDIADSETHQNHRLVDILPAWTAGANPVAKRANHTTTILPDGRLLIAGGSNGPSSLQSAEIFDPVANAFSATGSMASVHDLHTATLLPNGRVLVAGGFTSNASSTGSTNVAEIYYANPGIWIPTSSMNVARDQHTATLLPDGNVLVAGGFNKINGYLNSAEIYVSTIGAWQSLGNVMPAAVARHTATLLQDGEVLFAGGINNGGIRSGAFVYNPTQTAQLCAAGAWCAVASFANGARTYLHTATLLPSGQVLVAGGDNGLAESNLSQLFDPNVRPSGAWTPTQKPLVTPRANHTAVLLPDGGVMLVGGAGHLANSLGYSETFDVGDSSWTTQRLMLKKRAYHTTTMLSDGTLLSVGGISGANYLASSERLYFGFNDSGSNGAPPSVRVSSITSIDATNPATGFGSFNYGSTVTFFGRNFMGFTEANSGTGGSGQSAFYQPRLSLQALDGGGGSSSQGNSGFLVDLTTRIYFNITGSGGGAPTDVAADQVNTWTKLTGFNLAASSITIKMPDSQPGCGAGPNFLPCEQTLMPTGWYQVRMANNSLYSGGLFTQVGPPRISSSIAPVYVGVPGNAGVFCSTAVTFSWANIPGVDGYNVYSTSAAVWITSLTANQNFFTQGNLSANTTASITVAPFTIMGDGPAVVSATGLTLATVPVNVTISSVASNSVLLSWGANGNGPGTTYEVTYASVTFSTFNALTGVNNPPGFEWFPVAPVPPNATVNDYKVFPFGHVISTPTAIQTPSYTPPLTATVFQVDSLVANTTYFFRVRAFNSNQVPSGYSNIPSTATRTPISGIVSSPCASPDDPTTCIKWKWDDLAPTVSPVSYNVRTTTGGLLAFHISTNTFFDRGLKPNSTRQIEVSAITAPGEGDLITSATAYTLAATPVLFNPPQFPYNKTGNYISSGTLTPQWDRGTNPGPPNATTYKVFFSSFIGPGDFSAFTGVVSEIDVVDKGISPMLASFGGLTPAEIYGATITAFNNQAPGPVPSQTSLILQNYSPYPNPPVGIALVGSSPNSLSVQWDTNGNASTATYAVYYTSVNPTDVPDCAGFTTRFSTALYYTAPNNFLNSNKNSLGLTIGNLLTNTTYAVAVCARDAFGDLSPTVNGIATNIRGLTNGGGAVNGSFTSFLSNPNIDNDFSGTVGIGSPRQLTLHIPAGAFPSPVAITFSSFTNTTPLCPGTTNIGISINTIPAFQPLKPLTISVAFSPSELAGMDASQVSLERFDPVTSKCIPFLTSVNAAGGVINAQINHFTVFVVGAVTPSNTVESARIFPNPFFPATDGFVTFENVPPYARIRIWTLQGEAIYDRQANGAGLLTWPGINKNGRFVASGTYFVTFEAVGSTQPRKILKMVVLR